MPATLASVHGLPGSPFFYCCAAGRREGVLIALAFDLPSIAARRPACAPPAEAAPLPPHSVRDPEPASSRASGGTAAPRGCATQRRPGRGRAPGRLCAALACSSALSLQARGQLRRILGGPALACCTIAADGRQSAASPHAHATASEKARAASRTWPAASRGARGVHRRVWRRKKKKGVRVEAPWRARVQVRPQEGQKWQKMVFTVDRPNCALEER